MSLENQSQTHTDLMQRINQQLEEIQLQLDRQPESWAYSEQREQYDCKSRYQLIMKIEKMKKDYQQELQSIKLQLHLQESMYGFNQQKHKTRFDEMEHQRDCLRYQNEKLKEQIKKYNQQLSNNNSLIQKYEIKIRNQESLIDQYKNSMEQQMNLQKQVLKSSFLQKQLMIKSQFEKALKCMEQNYQRKINEIKHQSIVKDYQFDVKTVKKLCNTLSSQKNRPSLMNAFETENKNSYLNKQNINQSSCKKLNGVSSYSTLEK